MSQVEFHRSQARTNFQGLKDCGHVYINCSNCSAPLVDVWIVDDRLDVEWQIIAECPHCGDKSFPTTFKGRFYPGPGVVNPDKTDIDGTKDIIYTYIDTFDDQNGCIVVKTKKGREWNG